MQRDAEDLPVCFSNEGPPRLPAPPAGPLYVGFCRPLSPRVHDLHPMAVVPALATAETGHYEDENEHGSGSSVPSSWLRLFSRNRVKKSRRVPGPRTNGSASVEQLNPETPAAAGQRDDRAAVRTETRRRAAAREGQRSAKFASSAVDAGCARCVTERVRTASEDDRCAGGAPRSQPGAACTRLSPEEMTRSSVVSRPPPISGNEPSAFAPKKSEGGCPARRSSELPRHPIRRGGRADRPRRCAARCPSSRWSG